jgi:hypothetical protein
MKGASIQGKYLGNNYSDSIPQLYFLISLFCFFFRSNRLTNQLINNILSKQDTITAFSLPLLPAALNKMSNALTVPIFSDDLYPTYFGLGQVPKQKSMYTGFEAGVHSQTNFDAGVCNHKVTFFLMVTGIERISTLAILLVICFLIVTALTILLYLQLLQQKKARQQILLDLSKNRTDLAKEKKRHFLKQTGLTQKIEDLSNQVARLNEENKIIKEVLNQKNTSDLVASSNKNGKTDFSWSDFNIKFSILYPTFEVNIKRKHPNLSAGDIQFCKLLKLQIPHHEIAELLNITMDGLYKKRYRLTKKMKLSNSLLLNSHLQKNL